MSNQGGQALISVLVVMTLLFIAAGVIAVGTSTLVISERQPDNTVKSDLIVQSAIAAAIGSSASVCTTTRKPGSPGLTAISARSIAVPNAMVGSYCVGLTSTPSKPTPLTATNAGLNCWVAPLPGAVSGSDWWFLFNATWPAGITVGHVTVASLSSPGCPSPPSQSPCRDSSWTILSTQRQLALYCALVSPTPSISNPGLVFQGVHPSAILAGQGGGTTAAPTYFILREQTPAQPHDQEAVVSVGSGGATLLYEAQLP
jgi:hypothetical protein